jgi:hypothetical protein
MGQASQSWSKESGCRSLMIAIAPIEEVGNRLRLARPLCDFGIT